MKDYKSKQYNDNEKENEKKKKGSLLISLISAIIATIIIHLIEGKEIANLFSKQNNWAYYIILLIIFFVSFTLAFLLSKGIIGVKKEPSTEDKKKKDRTKFTEFIFLAIDLLATGSFVYINWANLTAQGIMMSIAEVAVFFAIVWMIFELFNHFKMFPGAILTFIAKFMVTVCIPMLLLLIIMLGAYQAKYNYEDIFTPAVIKSATTLGDAMENAYLNLVFTLYNIGKSNPIWTWLPIAAFFLFTLILLITTFTKKEKTDEELSAQELIDVVLEEEREEKAYESGGKKRPLSYNLFKKIDGWMTYGREGSKAFKKYIANELKEKEEDKKYLDVDFYNITLERRSDKK